MTAASMKVGLTPELIEQAKAVLKSYDKGDATLLVTGGDGEWLVSMLKDGAYHEDLVLEGLNIALAGADTQKGMCK